MTCNGKKVGHDEFEETTRKKQGLGQHIDMGTVDGCRAGVWRGVI